MSSQDIRDHYYQTRSSFRRKLQLGHYTNVGRTHVVMEQDAPSTDPIVNEEVIDLLSKFEGAQCKQYSKPHPGSSAYIRKVLECQFSRDAFEKEGRSLW
jgi:hypothetical protein